jgi:thiamine-monophosphate kinase
VDEFELIRRFFTRPSTDPGILLGIGDDGAIVRPAKDRELVVVIDTLVEGVHFPPGMNPADIGYRAVAVNLSDIAAMAATPRWMTLALTLTAANAEWLNAFSTGLFEAADEHSIELIGGDTTHGSQIVVTVQLTGDVQAAKALRRSGAAAGDDIYVTGTPGDAAAGLALSLAGSINGTDERYLYRRFARPTARVVFARRLAAFASAAIDLSDGLHADIEKLLTASERGGRIDVEMLPLSPELLAVSGKDAAIDLALGGGDDYEIAFTAAPEQARAIRDLAADLALRVTRIGAVLTTGGLQCFRHGQPFALKRSGYRHFGVDSDA